MEESATLSTRSADLSRLNGNWWSQTRAPQASDLKWHEATVAEPVLLYSSTEKHDTDFQLGLEGRLALCRITVVGVLQSWENWIGGASLLYIPIRLLWSWSSGFPSQFCSSQGPLNYPTRFLCLILPFIRESNNLITEGLLRTYCFTFINQLESLQLLQEQHADYSVLLQSYEDWNI